MNRQQSNKTGLHSSAEKDSVRQESDEQHGKGSPVGGASGGREDKERHTVYDTTGNYIDEKMQEHAKENAGSEANEADK